MRKKLTKELKNEILLTLKNKSYEVSEKSLLGKIFNVEIELYELFESPKNLKICRECKIELLQWLKQGYIKTDDSIFSETVRHFTFLDLIMMPDNIETDGD